MLEEHPSGVKAVFYGGLLLICWAVGAAIELIRRKK